MEVCDLTDFVARNLIVLLVSVAEQTGCIFTWFSRNDAQIILTI